MGFPQNRKQPDYALWRGSEDTDSLWRPLALLAAKTLLPFALDIRSRKPCLFLLLRWEGWNVLFISLSVLYAF